MVASTPGSQPGKLAFQHALTQALTDSATHYPGRDLRYFAEILRDIGGPLLARTLQPAATLPTADELTALWLNHLTVDSLIHYRGEFTQFATHFLDRLQFHLENQQTLQWIAQARRQRSSEEAMRRMAEAAEQSAINFAALRQEIARLTAALVTVLQTGSSSTVTTGGGAYIGGNVSGQNIAGRNLTIKNYFVAGLPRLVIDYSSRIQDFLLEYLGSKRKRVPFGGRQQQLSELNAWLDDPTAPPYYLMTAEAGRGKSALVCRWLAQLTTRNDLDVIFVPISIRFETATQDVVFAALAARLANLYESEREKLPPASLTAEQWKAVCQSYLRRELPANKLLVVILDGLDEAAESTLGRSLFSADPPSGLRVLVTARTRPSESGASGWANTLGWDNSQLTRTVTLPSLNRRGVEEALVSMGNPLDKLATQVDVVGELHRLSEGDPLLVRLYVDVLITQGAKLATLRAEDLYSIEPGLAGYFGRWWQDQREQWWVQGRNPIAEQANLRLLLNAIAASLGPLTVDDLAALHPDLMDSILLYELLENVSRWLVGDGKVQGYSYSHPRLALYFWEQLGRHEQKAWDERYIRWGVYILHELNTDMMPPELAPRYLLQHYATHLIRAKALPDQFYALISNGWHKAWEVLDVSYAGFLNDTDQVWKQARQAYNMNEYRRAEALIQQVRAALCRSSIAALGSNIKPELLAQLVSTGLRTPVQALAIVKLVTDEDKQAKMLIALAPRLPNEVLAEVLSTACAIRDSSIRADALSALAQYLPNELLAEVLTATRAIEDEYHRAKVLSELVPYLFHELLADVLSTVRAIRDVSARTYVLRALASHLPTEFLVEAWEVANSLEDEYYRDSALAALAPRLPKNERMSTFVKGLSAVHTVKSGRSRVDRLFNLAQRLPMELLGEALAAARAIRDVSARVHVLRDLAAHLSIWVSVQRRYGYPIFADNLPVLAARPRPQFVDDLTALMPFILALAGDEAPQAAEGIYLANPGSVWVVAVISGFGTTTD